MTTRRTWLRAFTAADPAQLCTPQIAVDWWQLRERLLVDGLDITPALAAAWADRGYLPAEAEPLIRKGEVPDPLVRITVGGRPALTTAQAAVRHDRDPAVMRMLLSARRYNLPPVAMLDPRTPLYDMEAVDKLVAGMRGRRRAD